MRRERDFRPIPVDRVKGARTRDIERFTPGRVNDTTHEAQDGADPRWQYL
jgi:hypothetical protein